MKKTIISADEWFSKGHRITYNPKSKSIAQDGQGIKIYHRLENESEKLSRWITLLPGFPDGSFGWASVENELERKIDQPRLYIEYVGQGDSDKPNNYKYSTIERADLVEAIWQFYNIEDTFVVTFDYSSLVALELLRRQQSGSRKAKITKVLLINGGLFADAHSHPIMTTPLLKTAFGKMGARIAQRSTVAFNVMMKGLWSKEYGVSKKELNEVFSAITRRNGALFMSSAAGFVDEHKRNANRWDLFKIYQEMYKEVSFHIIGSEKDQFERNQVVKARERLGKHGVDIRELPGGHMTTSEQPLRLATIIENLSK